jgi:arabinoxylan arabinofuranohydrolase
MISLAETPKPLQFDRKFGPYGEGKLDDKPFLHGYRGTYYMSWGCYYATSNDIYGPWHYHSFNLRRLILLFSTSHPYLDGHGSFFTLYGQTYFACNDYSQSGTSVYYTNTIISYVHYKENGEIEPLEINALGVGQYSASKIEAENFFSISNAVPSIVKKMQPFSALIVNNGSNHQVQGRYRLQSNSFIKET